MTIKECIDIVDDLKPNQYSTKVKIMWLSFIDEIIINDVLKTHKGYDGRYDDFTGYSEDKLSVPLVVMSPYDRLYTAYLKMKIDGENGETARYNNSASLFNSYMMEYRKFYNKTHLPLSEAERGKANCKATKLDVTEAQLEYLKRELYPILAEDINKAVSNDKIYDIVMNYVNNNIGLLTGGMKTSKGTLVSQNADFAEVAEWADGNPYNEDRTGYFVCANVPLNGIVMKKATSIDDVKGVTILAPAFAGNYTKDKLDSNGNLLPKYSYVAIIGFVPVIDNGTCTVGGRCMPDNNGCAIPSNNSMGYQVVNRIDEKRVLIIIEPNGDMVQRIKTKINDIQEDIKNLAPDQTYNPESENAQSGKAVAEAVEPYEYLKKDDNGYTNIDLLSSKHLEVAENYVVVLPTADRFLSEVPVFLNNGVNISGETFVETEPTTEYSIATKGYVDGLVGDIETVLDNIIAIQNELIGGESI